jgi:hypothetical protein
MFAYPLMLALEGVGERQQQALDEIRASQPRFIVGAFLASSLLEQPDTPRVLRDGLRELVESSYRLVAATAFKPDGRVAFVKGAAQSLGAKSLPYYRGSWRLVIWERLEPVPTRTGSSPWTGLEAAMAPAAMISSGLRRGRDGTGADGGGSA